MRNRIPLVLLGWLLALSTVWAQNGDIHLVMGNPSKAKHDADHADNYLMVKEQFALSYNDKKGIPNWVSYRLEKADFGKTARPSTFHPDPDLPRGFHVVKPLDYHFGETGFSRGHMCPNNHRSDSLENAKATFVMTNMVPQTMELNDGAWKDFEIYCANVARRSNKELFIVCGPHGIGGTSTKGVFKTIGNGHISVPRSCWKVVLIIEGGSNSPLARVNAKSRVIGVVMPNDHTPEKRKWHDYAVSAESVEQLTGYRFFDRAPAEIITALKSKVDHGR